MSFIPRAEMVAEKQADFNHNYRINPADFRHYFWGFFPFFPLILPYNPPPL